MTLMCASSCEPARTLPDRPKVTHAFSRPKCSLAMVSEVPGSAIAGESFKMRGAGY